MWEITAVAHGLLTASYLWIAFLIGKGQHIERQWRSNPLASATFAIFLTCAIGHAVHVEHAVIQYSGESEVTNAARVALADPMLVVWTPLTALAAIYYLSKRKRLHILQGGAPMVEDMQKRQKEAAILHDAVMVSASKAQALLEAGDKAAASKEIEEALTGAEDIITALLGNERSVHRLEPGDLRRSRVSR